METGYKWVFNRLKYVDLAVDKTDENLAITWVKLVTCTRIAGRALVGPVYENRGYPLFTPLSIRRLYTFFTQAVSMLLS